MLETIHDYARECLRKSGESELITRRLVEWLTAIAKIFAAEAELSRAPSIEQLERELDNLRAAIRAALGWPRDPLALRLTTALLRFWTMTGRHGEGLRWTAEALIQPRTRPLRSTRSASARPSSSPRSTRTSSSRSRTASERSPSSGPSTTTSGWPRS